MFLGVLLMKMFHPSLPPPLSLRIQFSVWHQWKAFCCSSVAKPEASCLAAEGSATRGTQINLNPWIRSTSAFTPKSVENLLSFFVLLQLFCHTSPLNPFVEAPPLNSEDADGDCLTLWLRAGAHRGHLERPVGFALGHGDLHALLWRHGDVWLGFRDGGEELVHVRFLLLEKLVWGDKHKLPTSQLVWHAAARWNVRIPITGNSQSICSHFC